ncbi:MAG: DUF2339 domain-containing protein [Phycisphaerales bacterium JB059]
MTPPPAEATRPAWSWEQLVGGKLFAALGALIVVSGLALFLKLAYDLGWLNQISGAGKCSIGAGFGALLLASGEVARRRWNALASAGLTAAGIGAMYASAYSAFRFYELFSPPVAFALLAAISVLGVIVAMRARLVSVAFLSILGAYLTPVLLAQPEAPVYILPAYLLLIAAYGLWLSATHARFRVLRSLVWWGTAVMGGLWVLARAADAPMIVVAFCILTWLAFHAELLWSARHGGIAGPGRHAHDVARPLVVSLATTAWSVLLAAFAIDRDLPQLGLWLAPGGALVMTLLASMILSGHLRVLRDTPANDEERLGAVLLAQAGALLIATIAMGITTDWLQVACWLVFGVASVFAGRWIGSRSLNVYGLVVLSVGLARLVLLDFAFGAMRTGGVTLWGVVLTEWTLMMAIAGACWIAAGRLLVRKDSTPRDRCQTLPAVCGSVGALALLGSLAHEQSEPAPIALACALLALAGAGAHRLDRRLAIDLGALAPVVASVAAWTWAYVFPGWDQMAGEATVHLGLWSALGLAGILGGVALTLRRVATLRGALLLPATLGVLLVLVSTSFELSRQVVDWTDDPTARAGAVSIWWGLFAVALLAWGFLARSPVVRWSGLGLLGVATGKALIFDLAGVDPAWRVASFLALGLLLLGVGAGYLRRTGRDRAMSPPGEDSDPLG